MVELNKDYPKDRKVNTEKYDNVFEKVYESLSGFKETFVGFSIHQIHTKLGRGNN